MWNFHNLITDFILGVSFNRTQDLIKELWEGKDLSWFYKSRLQVEGKIKEATEERELLKKPEDRRKKNHMIEDKKEH